MNTVQPKPHQLVESNDQEVPDWFYFFFGMMIVIFSGLKNNNENLNSENIDSNQFAIHDCQENFSWETSNMSEVDLINVEVLLESYLGVENVNEIPDETSYYNFREKDFLDQSVALLPN